MHGETVKFIFSVCCNVKEIAAQMYIIVLIATYMYESNSYMNNFCVQHTITIQMGC